MNPEELPFVECPVLHHLDITVLPFWFKSKSGDKNMPAVMLTGVPETFSAAIRSLGGIERPEGWLIEVMNRSESYWNVIFKGVKTEQRRAKQVIETTTKTILPVPRILHSSLARVDYGQVEDILKREGINNRSDLRLSLDDARRGAINSRGAWTIILKEATEVIRKAPEAKDVFEYIWQVSKDHNKPTGEFPDVITLEMSLNRIVEAKGYPKGLLTLLPQFLQLSRGVKHLCKISWNECILYRGGKLGGPIERVVYDRPEFLASALLLESPALIVNQTVLLEFESRVIETYDQDLDIANDEENKSVNWVDDIELPEEYDNNDTYESEASLQGNELVSLQSYQCSLNDCLLTLSDLYARSSQRTVCASVASQDVLSISIRLPLFKFPKTVPLAKYFIDRLESVVNSDSLISVAETTGSQIADCLQDSDSPIPLKAFFNRMVLNPQSYADSVEPRSSSGARKFLPWWLKGFSIDRAGLSSNSFSIYKLKHVIDL